MDKRKTKSHILSQWMSEDGLLTLRPLKPGNMPEDSKEWGDRPPHGQAKQRTAENDNGLLFVTEFYLICEYFKILDISDQKRWMKTMEDLEKTPGLYHKNPGRTWRNSSHDDYVGIMAGSVLFNSNHRIDILKYGEKNGFFYNNVDKQFELERVRQGFDIAFYKLCNGHMPVLWHYVWLLGSTASALFKRRDKNSSRMLSWLRLSTIERAFNRDFKKEPKSWHFLYSILIVWFHLWKWIVKKKFGWDIGDLIAQYYTPPWHMPNHPIKELAKGMK